MSHPDTAPDALVAEVRRFDRFYTAHVGALDEHLMASPFTLAEARVLYEVGQRRGATAAVLGRDLRLDPAYLSRIVRRLTKAGTVTRHPDPSDGRGRILDVTAKGREAVAALDQAARDKVGGILAALPPESRGELATAMREVRAILGDRRADSPAVIRPHRMGEVSWVVHRQTVLYRDEYGWDERFEGLVSEIAGKFLLHHDPAREQCWVAERDGSILGSIFVVDAGEGVAKLRLLYVEQAARGLGLGRKLSEECMAFARRAGYRRMTLWTNDCLTAARKLYDLLGFMQVSEQPHSDFGVPMVGQVLERDL